LTGLKIDPASEPAGKVDSLTISVTLNRAAAVQIQMVQTGTGKTVKSFSGTALKGSNAFHLLGFDGRLAAGTYLITVTATDTACGTTSQVSGTFMATRDDDDDHPH